MRAPVYILEGTWWSRRETPLVLPYFEALATSHREITLSHRTIRSADDIAYYVRRLGAGEQAFLYFASHGSALNLLPAGGSSPIRRPQLLEALGEHKEGSIGFLHFGCCEMVSRSNRRGSLSDLMDASGAKWVSGYTKDVDWLRSTILDLLLVAEYYVHFHGRKGKRGPKLVAPAQRFMDDFDQFARSLGFSGLSRGVNGQHGLFPKRLEG
jgi:hypothetical protein